MRLVCDVVELTIMLLSLSCADGEKQKMLFSCRQLPVHWRAPDVPAPQLTCLQGRCSSFLLPVDFFLLRLWQ